MHTPLCFAVIALYAHVLSAQIAGRYQKAVFDSITITKDIQYGEADFYDASSNHDPAPLYLDFYEPRGDTLQARPLVITIFGGAFLAGNKEWADMVAWCDSLAHSGYVCASIQYRLSFNPLRQESIIRASYRAVQDTRAAIRFLAEHASAYRIDTNKIFLLGNSAGSITALLTAFISKDSERPPSTYGVGTASDADDLGCLDCSGNSYAHRVRLAGIISLWGGLWDIGWLESDEQVPALLVHGTADGTVPYDTGYAFGIALSPFVYGSLPIDRKMTELEIPHEFHPFDGLWHSFYMEETTLRFPNEYWEPVFTLGREFLYKHTGNLSPAAGQPRPYEDIRIFPNPSDGVIFLDIPALPCCPRLTVMSIQGVKITSLQLSSLSAPMDISYLPEGLYFLAVQIEHRRLSAKVAVNRAAR